MKRLLLVILIIGLGVSAFFLCPIWFHRPRVSVVMSTYNREQNLPIALQSVLEQTMPDFEFIIINDGSNDNTHDIIRAYKNKDSRIVFLENKQNRGLIYSLNRGFKKARGDYIARIDDDDAMLPERLEKQLEYMDKNPTVSVLGTHLLVPSNNKILEYGCPTSSDLIHVKLHFKNIIAHPSTMLRRSFLKTHNLLYDKEFKHAEDYDLWRRILLNNGQINCLPIPLIIYKRAGDNPSSFYRDQYHNTKKIISLFYSRFVDDPDELLKKSQCEIIEVLIDKNKSRHILNQKTLEEQKLSFCPPNKT